MAGIAALPKSDTSPSPFIVTTSLDKADPQTRKLIRSHVMRGKNKGKTMPRKGKKPPQSPHQPAFEVTPAEHGQPHAWDGWSLVSPRQVASDLSLFPFVHNLTPYMRELIFRAFTIVKPATFAVQLFGSDSESSGMFCFDSLSSHPAMVPSLLFTAQAFRDMSSGVDLTSFAHAHLAKTLQLLQSSLADEEQATSFETMVVVSSLATAAVVTGDLEAAGKHLDGLHRMVEVRGGLSSLGPINMITYKALTLDLGLAMGTGTKPRFSQTDISWSPQIAVGPSARVFHELDALQPRPDPRLMNIWLDLREFSARANAVVEEGRTMQPGLFYRLSTSVLYRLLHLQYDQRSHSELLRLGMLAYTKTLIIRLPGLGKRMTFIAGQLEAELEHLPNMTKGSLFLFWVLNISALSIFEDTVHDWFCQHFICTAAALHLHTWSEAKTALKRFLWVDTLHDPPARLLFQTLMVSDCAHVKACG